MVLQKMVDTALKDAPALAEFSARLKAAGVRVIPNQASTGRISDISFQYDGITMKGGDLGRGYTWAGLQKRGLYEQIRPNGRDEGRSNTQAGSSHAGLAGDGAPIDADRSASGGYGPRVGTTGAGSVQPEQQHQTGYMQAVGGMRGHTHDNGQLLNKMGEAVRVTMTITQNAQKAQKKAQSAGALALEASRLLQEHTQKTRLLVDVWRWTYPLATAVLVNLFWGALLLWRLPDYDTITQSQRADMAKVGGHERGLGDGQERGRAEAIALPRRQSREERER